MHRKLERQHHLIYEVGSELLWVSGWEHIIEVLVGFPPVLLLCEVVQLPANKMRTKCLIVA